MSQTRVKAVSVPPLRVVFEEEDRKRILSDLDACLASGMVAAAQQVKAFEDEWAAYCRCRHAVACSNGGAALELIMRALDVRGKDVLVPANTFIATAQSVIAAGGNVVFLDADPRTMGVSLAEIQRKCTQNTAGVVVVHIGGIISAELAAIAEWTRSRGLWLVEDAAHAHGSDVDGRRAGQFGIAAAYSFFATKVVTSGEGGMVVTDDEGLAQECRSLRDYGKKSQWESVHTRLSGNHRMSDLTAIVARHQIRRLDEFIAERADIARRYTKSLEGRLELVLPEGRSSWYKYIAYLPKTVDRAAFKTTLKERGVGLGGGVYDLPLHRQPVFESLGVTVSLPNADDVCARHVCLPVFFGMSAEQAEHVIESVSQVLGKIR